MVNREEYVDELDRDLDCLQLGSQLSKEQADNFEKALIDNPTDIASRIILLGYYWRRWLNSDDVAQTRIKHIAWFVQHKPDHHILREGMLETLVRQDTEPEGYVLIYEFWQEQINLTPHNSAALMNAAYFLSVNDSKQMAEQCLLQAIDLKSVGSAGHMKLANFYKNWPGHEQQALKECENALALESDAESRFDCFAQLCVLAFKAGDRNKSTYAARKTLVLAENYQSSWNYGNATHIAHIILGRIALQNGDRDQAKQYLELAGASSGSPQLSTFGPDMRLAAELLQLGEGNAVLRYLGQCGSFWESGRKKLERWRAQIEQGDFPWGDGLGLWCVE